jgi:hypothetical protein|tara:strand:+ start:519 stop:668 length:150 start_codon:yes stop_codon:yes gene_type:complete
MYIFAYMNKLLLDLGPLKDRLAKAASKRGQSMSSVIRELVYNFLKTNDE